MKTVLLSTALLVTGVASAATPVDGWYTSGFGGYAYVQDNIRTTLPGLYINGTSYKGGYNVGGRVGFQSNPIRYEAEYTYLYANANHFNINNIRQIGSTGSTTGSLFMANLYYDFPDIVPAISPFLGVGMGVAVLKTNLSNITPIIVRTFSFNESKFAYQGTLGFTYNFAENYAANIAYRYVATGNGGDFGRAYQAHLASAGVIYRFDKGYYK